MTNVTYKYATVLVAIQNLRNEGYNVDFNLEENCLICGANKYTVDDFEIEQMLSFASLSEEDRRSDTMKDKDEQTALIGMAIGAAVISLVATQKQINQGSIVDELVRLGRQKGDGVEDEVFVQAARLVRKGT